MLTNQVTLLV